jgi:hypothetical protein
MSVLLGKPLPPRTVVSAECTRTGTLTSLPLDRNVLPCADKHNFDNIVLAR